MLSELLSSKYKSNVVNLFLAHPQRSFTVTEIRASTECPTKALIETLRTLNKMGFLLVFEKNKVKSYQVDRHFALYPELVGMLKKIRKVPLDLLAKNVVKIGNCKLIVFTGIFTGRPRVETDILIVGKISQTKFEKFLKIAEKFAEQEVNYTLFTPQELDYRRIMSDRFLKNILENNHVAVIDKTKNRVATKIY